MSTNLETSRKVSPSSDRRRRMARAAVAAAVGCAALFAASRLPWMKLLENARERRDERASLAPLAAEAERAAATYPQVVDSYPLHKDKAVYWDVSVTSATSYVDGRISRTVLWTNPESVARADLEYRKNVRLLARVADVKGGVVFLEYLGRP